MSRIQFLRLYLNQSLHIAINSGLAVFLFLWFLMPELALGKLADSATAQNTSQATSKDTSLDTLVVTAVRVPGHIFTRSSANMTVVPLEEARGGSDLAELLAVTAGLQMRRYGGLGAPVVPSIRGSSGGQIVVMVDGLPLSDAQSGLVNLSSLPLERFARAEVYRGSVPVRYGGRGGVGAVNLISRTARSAGSGLRFFTGSYGDVGGRLSHSVGSSDGSGSGLLLIHGRRIDNDYPYLDHNQTLANQSDDVWRVRENSGFQEWGGSLGGQLELATVAGRGMAGYFHKEGGRPGPLGFPSPHAKVRMDRLDGQFALQSVEGHLGGDVTVSRSREWLFDPAGEVGFDPPGTTSSESHDLTGRLHLTNSPTFGLVSGPIVQWRVGGDWRRQWYHESHLGSDTPSSDPLRVRTTAAATTALNLNLLRLNLALQPSFRWLRAQDNFPPLPQLPWLPEETLSQPHTLTANSPALAVIWSPVPDRLTLVTHVSRSARLPTWIELFGHRGGIAGNRELLPEDIRSADIGMRWHWPSARMHHRLTVFRTRSEDTIIFVQNSQRTSQAVNFGTTETAGLEWEGGIHFPHGGRLAGNVTWQDARFRTADPAYHGKELPFLPPLEAALLLELPIGGWRLGTALIHEAANFRDAYNIELDRAPARTVVNLSLQRTWHTGAQGSGAAVTVTAELINLTDDRVYDVEGYPLPGRSFRLSTYLR